MVLFAEDASWTLAPPEPLDLRFWMTPGPLDGEHHEDGSDMDLDLDLELT